MSQTPEVGAAICSIVFCRESRHNGLEVIVATGGLTNKSVLIVDEEDAFTAALGRGFRSLGFDVSLSIDYACAKAVAENENPYLVVTELKVRGHWAFSEIEELRNRSPASRVAIVTAYPSVATAVRSVRLGYDAYVVKPVTPQMVLELVAEPPMADDSIDPGLTRWPSLDRTIWEHINQVFVAAGSMSEAARRLHLDRRSLRRMLAKYPPRH